MKKYLSAFFLTITCIMILFACSNEETKEEKEQIENEKTASVPEMLTKEKRKQAYQEEQNQRLQQGILVYGEGVKGGQYAISVEQAHSKSKNNVEVEVSIKNVRGDGHPINTSELKFNLEGNSTTYEGKFEPIDIASKETQTFTVNFEVGQIENQFMFSIESSVDPISAKWIIDNLD